MSLMSRLSLAIAGVLFTGVVHTAVLDQPVVARYVAGWVAHDGAAVQSTFAPDGRYVDPSLGTPLTRAGIAAHVEAHREARLTLLGATETVDGRIELSWKIVWPDRRGESHYVDVLQLHDGSIRNVDSAGMADAAAVKLVDDYQAMHNHPSPESLATLFTPDFVVLGSTIPADGLRGDAYLSFLQSLKGTVFSRNEGSTVLLTKDNRVVMSWSLKAGEKRLAGGVDYLTLDGHRISKIVGVY